MAYSSASSNGVAAAMFLIGIFLTGAEGIGVCNGRVGDNLPSEQETVNLFQRIGIPRMRIYDPNKATLQALQGTNIELVLGTRNEEIGSLGDDPSAASEWVRTYVLAYPDVKFRYISVGNEVSPSDPVAHSIAPAMQNIHNALKAASLGNIKVSTTIETSMLGISYPPSHGAFSDVGAAHMKPIIGFLLNTGSPILVNVFPYFAYISDPKRIDLGYATFTSLGVAVQDGPLGYHSLFDAMLDALFSAFEKAGAANLQLVVAETGWPSAGHPAATVKNAATYYQNVVSHVDKGTPKRPGQPIETYLFAMFDEDRKGPAETEKHFGLFSPLEQPKYQLQLRTSSSPALTTGLTPRLPSPFSPTFPTESITFMFSIMAYLFMLSLTAFL